MTNQSLSEQIREAGEALYLGQSLTSWREFYEVQRQVSAFVLRWQSVITGRILATSMPLSHRDIKDALSAIYCAIERLDDHLRIAARSMAGETTTLEEMGDKDLQVLTDAAENMAYHLDRAVSLVDGVRVVLDDGTFASNSSIVSNILDLGSRGLVAIRDGECQILQGFAMKTSKMLHERKQRLQSNEVTQ
ncbi:MAG: hypothetical protein ABI459_12055 [Deltaproteobacteria bacterium]